MSAKKHILILATGGTIASKQTGAGLAPSYSIDQIIPKASLLRTYYDLTMQDILSLDSSNIQIPEWQTIARAIYASRNDYDGIVVTHGTDTMAYTSSALSYMLTNLNLPVVLTGSQFPVDEPLSDAHDNLQTALAMAASGVPGVFLAFNRQVMLGTRAVKVRTLDFQAFESVNCPPIAKVNSSGLQFDEQVLQTIRYLRQQGGPMQLATELKAAAFLLKLTPAFNAALLDYLPALGYQAILLEAFGIGGINFLHKDLLQGLGKLIDAGFAVVVTSQCLYEQSSLRVYEVGRKLLDLGAIEAFDMSTEAAITKLYFALGQAEKKQITDPLRRLAFVKDYFGRNLAGEINLAKQPR